jgi:6-phosphogluconolactonase
LRHCAAFSLLLLAPAALGEAPADRAAGPLWAYVGTYTHRPPSQGIYRLEFDRATGKLSAPALAGKSGNPSFLAISPDRRFLYAVAEGGPDAGKSGGAVRAFALDPKTGDLTLLNAQSSKGADPCHIVLDSKGRHALVANYSGGSVCVLPIGPDGKLGKATAFVQHTGKSVSPGRQKEPHAHSINLSPDERFAFVADLGLDKVLIYKFDRAAGTLTPNDPPSVSVAPGAGPRHFAFHPSGKWAYVINELSSTLTAFSYDAKRGALTEIQTVPTLTKPFKGNSTAEVVVHPSGRFVYGSNRGHNSIAVFSVDLTTGKLTPAGHQRKGIRVPRNFAVEPSGKWMLVGSQAGDEVLVFRIDEKTGMPQPTEHKAKVGMPVCVRFMPAPR